MNGLTTGFCVKRGFPEAACVAPLIHGSSPLAKVRSAAQKGNRRTIRPLSPGWRSPMAEKFNPAAHDKHAENPREALKADREIHEKLEAGLVDSFPASDPVSAA